MPPESSTALPALLKKSLEQHRNQDNIADDEELQSIMSKLDILNSKVNAYKAKIRAVKG